MNTYLVLKATGRGTKNGRSAIVLPLGVKKAKNFRVAGNIPELYHGMVIALEVGKGGKVFGYSLILDDKNREALIKAGVNPSEYEKTLACHTLLKEKGIGWNTAALGIEGMYETLPFEEADLVHKATINNPKEMTRIRAITKKIIKTERNRRKIAYTIEEYLGCFDAIEQEGAYQKLMASLKIMCLKASSYSIQDGSIWDKELKEKEEFILRNIKDRKDLERNMLSEMEIDTFLKSIKTGNLEKEQLDTLESLRNTSPCIITGGAGVGKTTVIQTLINCYSSYYPTGRILLVAPTGKASRRLAEKTGLPASTIHRALRKKPEDDCCFYDESNPLPYRLVIIDESSMIDTELMYDLLRAVDITAKVIFVGDHNQLYPVGYGEPFFDFLKMLEVFKLTINHRQAEGTDILTNAQRVLDGKPLSIGRGVKVSHISTDRIAEVIVTNDAETQIISPYNELNAQINDYLKLGEEPFNAGDKIMTIKNSKEYCNGDIGTVISADRDLVTVDIDGNTIDIEGKDLEDLTLAYSITVHKMQGSEAKRVIILLPEKSSFVDKRMLYTAVTRARNCLEVYYYSEE